MNQPIPRSFFKDGQRARYYDRLGTIVIDKSQRIYFKDETLQERLLVTDDEWVADYSISLYLELLDRTIDQVMEGDKISNGIDIRQVIGRVGDAVALSQIDGKVDWVQVSRLVDDKYEIVNSKEEMTE